jgi:hypothetical protein
MDVDKENTFKTNDAMQAYLTTCKHVGILETVEDQHNYYQKITRNVGWKHYKLVEGDDYHVSSEFSQYMIKVLKRDANHPETKDWWNSIRGTIQWAMQDMRSTCTQAVKRIF